ncbi:hypothetical protein [Nitrospirillum pindoramense]|uniref:Uncharacterized protein n=1 Tax=Nitrospirillum amazonense TaxID=28077 RepID=A0A560HH10_9PROT|nr:hypothetical protein [Nitrospirillum amazonense]TWB45726.1 hypothetical protein FBZ90_10159 [Nitrospirillum amazonense]
MSGILYVTGADERYFATTLLLLESFARQMPQARLMVCDYGLAPGQLAYLADRGQLLPRPEGLPETLHPYAKKAAILDYVGDLPWQALCWIDADMLAVGLDGAIMAHLLQRLEASGADIALTTDINELTLSDVAAMDAGGTTMAPFRALLAESGADPAAPYISVGFWLCRSRALLVDWDRRSRGLRPHPLFEQNVMALLIHGPNWGYAGRALLLDPVEWQPQNHLLPLIRTAGDGYTVRGRTVRLVHCTSCRYWFMDIYKSHVEVQGQALAGYFRILQNPALRALQKDLLHDHVVRHGDALSRHGLLTIADP